MNFSFYIFGTPEGFEQYPIDSNSKLFKAFAKNTPKTGSQLTIYRKRQLVYYVYIRSLANKGDYFGIGIILNGVYCHNTRKLFQFFTYTVQYEVVLKKKILYPANKFITNTFKSKKIEIDRLRSVIQQNFDLFGNDFSPLDNTFSENNDIIKTLLLDEGNNAINEAVHQYRQVVISTEKIIILEKEKKNKAKMFFIFAIITIFIAVAVFIIYQKQTPKYVYVTVKDEKIILENGSSYIYTGTMKSGKPEGEGTASYSDSSIYIGSFVNGLRHGKGKRTFSNGYIYTGDYVEDKAEGWGEMLEPNGYRFVGEWKNNNKNGKGTLYESSGKETQGIWQNGKKIQ